MSLQTKTYTQVCDHNYSLVLSVTEESTSTTNNTSAVSWNLKLKSTNYRFSGFRIGWSVSINGTVVSSQAWASAAYRSIDKNSEITIASSSSNVSISHDSDGTKSMAVSATMEISKESYSPVDGSSGTGTKTVSGTMTLTKIARASTMSIPSTVTIGTAPTFTIDKASSSFNHTITYSIGTASGTVVSKTSATSYSSWVPPDSLGSQISQSTSGTISFVLTTYSGNTSLGSRTYTATLSVPTYTPSVSLTTTLNNSANSTVSSWGVAVKGITKITYSVTAGTAYGATISGYEVNIGPTGEVKSNASGVSGVVSKTGSQTVTARVKDSRSKWSAKATKTITVYDYNSPVVSSCTAYRCTQSGTASASGTYLRIYCKATLGSNSTVGNRNSLSITYSTSKGNTGNLTSETPVILSGYDVSRTYTVTVTVRDTVGTVITKRINIPTETVTFHMKENGLGVAFGKYAETANLVDSAWPIKVMQGDPRGQTLRYLLGGETLTGSLDDLVNPGFYYVDGNAGRPVTNNYGWVLMLVNNTSATVQNGVQIYFAFNNNSPLVYVRYFVNSQWYNWGQITVS